MRKYAGPGRRHCPGTRCSRTGHDRETRSCVKSEVKSQKSEVRSLQPAAPPGRPIGMVRFAVLVLVSIVLATPEARQSSATVERDLAYGTDPTQRLDLSVPAGKGFPTVIFVHGGS